MTTQRSDLVRLEIVGQVAIITMNRAGARNAINAAMASGIENALDRSERNDDVWAIVLRAEGPSFCAGADLAAIASGDTAGISTSRGGFAGLVRRRRTKPLIAAVRGHAVAGGCEMVLACDLVVAARTARFGLPEVKRSLLAIEGGLWRLPQVLPRPVAMELALTGDLISAEDAARHGMVNVVCDEEDLEDETMRLAERVTANAPLAVQASRQVLNDAFGADEEEAWRLGRAALENLEETEDFTEGPRAFVERREARWTGRRRGRSS